MSKTTNPDGLDFELVRKSFQKAIKVLTSRSKRPEVRATRIYNSFDQSEELIIAAEVLAEYFPTQYPDADARTAVPWMNGIFQEIGEDIEIESIRCFRIRKRSTKEK